MYIKEVFDTDCTEEAFINRGKSLKTKDLFLFPHNSIIKIQSSDQNLKIYSPFSICECEIKNDNITTKTKLKWQGLFVILLLMTFFIYSLSTNKLIINGNPEPSATVQLGFYVAEIIIFSIPIIILVMLNKNFNKKVLKFLLLKKNK